MLRNTSKAQIVLCLSFALGLSACGGGSGTGTSSGLSASDFKKQVYASSSNGKEGLALTFLADSTGKRYSFNEDRSRETEIIPFAWNITSEKLDIAEGKSGNENTNIALKNKNGNKYTFTLTFSDGKVDDREFYKAKPLKVADFDAKILYFDDADDDDECTTTIKVSGTSASLKRKCDGKFETEELTLSQVSGLDNMVKFVKADNPSEETARLVLVKGSLNNGTLAVIADNWVGFDPVKTTNKEIQQTSSGLSASDFKKQVYARSSNVDESTVLTFLADSTGKRYSDEPSKETETIPFAWNITNGKLDIAEGKSGNENTNIALKNKNGNKYTFTLTFSDGRVADSEFYKAKPLKVSDFEGKILDLGSDDECTATTLKVSGTSASLKMICGGKYITQALTLSQVSGLDNMVKFVKAANPSEETARLVLVKGSLNNGTLAIVSSDWVGFSSIKTTNKEVQP